MAAYPWVPNNAIFHLHKSFTLTLKEEDRLPIQTLFKKNPCSLLLHKLIYIFVCVCVCVCVRIFMRETEKKKARSSSLRIVLITPSKYCFAYPLYFSFTFPVSFRVEQFIPSTHFTAEDKIA